MKCPADEEEADRPLSIDRLSSVSIVGFELFGTDGTKVRPGLLLRHGRDLFGRPVYEAENGGQFLYWMKYRGKLAEGMVEDDTELTGGMPDHRKLFANSGYWIISYEVGEPPEGPTCLAFIDDLAVTPDQINPRGVWHVAVSSKPKKEDGYIYEKSTSVRLHAEEWTRNASTLANFDEEDPTGSQSTAKEARPKS